MMLDELKAAWQQYDNRLQSAHNLSDKLIESMIKEKSQSRLSKIKQQYLFGAFYLAAWLFVGFAVLIGNPFDYSQTIEFVPIAIYCFCLAILILFMFKTHQQLQRVEINHDNLDNSLKKVSAIIEKYQRDNSFAMLTLKLMIATGTVLFPLSFLPRKIAESGLWMGIAETLIPIGISLVLVLIAYSLGAFKEQNSRKFKAYSAELNELKALSSELRNA